MSLDIRNDLCIIHQGRGRKGPESWPYSYVQVLLPQPCNKVTNPPSCLPTIDLFLYCIDVRVHDSGHSYSNIDITIFRDHEPIRVEHTVTRCVALVLVLIICEARDSAWIYIAWTYKLISVNIGL